MRKAKIERKTKETDIKISLNLDGKGKSKIKYPIPFFGHMLTLFSKHGLFDLTLSAKGDIEVDLHHLIEDTGLALGEAFDKALGDRKEIERFGHSIIPMDESLAEARVAVDISGRPHLTFEFKFSTKGPISQPVYVEFGNKKLNYKIDSDLLSDFFEAFSNKSNISMHIDLIRGKTAHHKIEAIFKAFGVALSRACEINPRKKGVPSTKGKL